MSQRPFFIDDYIVFFVDVAVAKFDVVSPADVVFVFRLVVDPLVLFVVGAVAVILVLLGIF